MISAARGFASAVSYFTILPLGRFSAGGPPDWSAIAWLPVVGAIVGAASGLVAVEVARIAPQPWPAYVAFACLIVFTGGVHVDGYLDCCDALFASVPAQRRLEIMKDPRHGTFALIGLAIAALFWIGALRAIPTGEYIVALTFASAVSRLSSVAPLLVFPDARGGFAMRREGRAAWQWLWLAALAIAIALFGRTLSPFVPMLVPCALAVGMLIAWSCARRLGGGLTGDVYGGIAVAVEIVVLATLAWTIWR